MPGRNGTMVNFPLGTDNTGIRHKGDTSGRGRKLSAEAHGTYEEMASGKEANRKAIPPGKSSISRDRALDSASMGPGRRQYIEVPERNAGLTRGQQKTEEQNDDTLRGLRGILVPLGEQLSEFLFFL